MSNKIAMDKVLSQKRAPLFEELLRYATDPLVGFHTPGHRGGKIFEKEWRIPDIWPHIDLTEISALDWENSLAEAEKLAARFYQADQSRFLVQGASQGIIGAILGVFSPGDRVLVARNCHISVYKGLILAGLQPVYLEFELIKPWGAVSGVKPDSLTRAVAENPDFKGLIITNPTYQGIACQLSSYRQAIGDRILMVDEAHGGHLSWTGIEGCDACQAADLWVQGTHKILGSLTQTGMVHWRNHRIDRLKLINGIDLISTTSPSYILLASLDSNRCFLAKAGQKMFGEKLPRVEALKARLNSIDGVEVLTSQALSGDQRLVDPWKLTVSLHQFGLSGFEAASILEQEFNIQPEFADLYQVTFFIAPWQEPEDLDQLYLAVRTITGSRAQNEGIESMVEFPEGLPDQAIGLHQAAFMPSRSIPLHQAEKQVSAGFITPYPPGVPLLVPGEVIREQDISYIQAILKDGGTVRGVSPTGEITTIIR